MLVAHSHLAEAYGGDKGNDHVTWTPATQEWPTWNGGPVSSTLWWPQPTRGGFYLFSSASTSRKVNMEQGNYYFPAGKCFVCVRACSVALTLCNPGDCSSPGFSVHGIFQARILECVAIPSSRESCWPREWAHISCVSCVGRQVLCHCRTWEVK